MARSIVRLDPFAELDTLRRDLFDDGLFRVLRGVNLPTTDVYTKDDKAVIVEAHLPGFEEKDVTVNIDHGALVIQAERREKDEDAKKKYVIRESSSSFYRRIALPAGAQDDGITATFSGDILKITIPLVGATAPKQIAITGAS